VFYLTDLSDLCVLQHTVETYYRFTLTAFSAKVNNHWRSGSDISDY